MLGFDDNNEDIDVARAHEWNIAQLIFASFGTCALYAFVKIPLMQYYGSGWSIVMFVVGQLILAPVIYVQLRLGSQYRRSLISLFGKFWPFGKGVAVAFLVRNLLIAIMHSVILMLTISYVAFSLYRCDRQICSDELYMWSSCQDWSSTRCTNVRNVTLGPTPESDFFNGFVFGQKDAFLYMEMPSQGGFPSWWNVNALNVVFLLVAWIVICLCTIFGPRAFGYVLYGIAPLSLVGLVIMIGWGYASVTKLSKKSLQDMLAVFYTRFSTSPRTLENFTWQPLEYGFLGMLVQLCFSLQLWSGQYTSMGKFVGYGRRTMKLIWLVPLITFALLGELPTIIMCAMLAHDYNINYVSIHLSVGYPAPFSIFTHVFSTTGISPAIAVVYFATLFLFTLISLSLLILTCTDNIVDSLRKSSRVMGRKVILVQRSCTLIICVVLFSLSLLLITKAGIYWIVLLDSFIDRFMCVLIPLAAIGYLMAYGRSTRGPMRGFVIAAFLFSILCVTAAYSWYLYNQLFSSSTSYNGYVIPTRFVIVGWLIASSPVVIGLSLAFVLGLCERDGRKGKRCKRMCCGSRHNDLPYFPRDDDSEEESKPL